MSTLQQITPFIENLIQQQTATIEETTNAILMMQQHLVSVSDTMNSVIKLLQKREQENKEALDAFKQAVEMVSVPAAVPMIEPEPVAEPVEVNALLQPPVAIDVQENPRQILANNLRNFFTGSNAGIYEVITAAVSPLGRLDNSADCLPKFSSLLDEDFLINKGQLTNVLTASMQWKTGLYGVQPNNNPTLLIQLPSLSALVIYPNINDASCVPMVSVATPAAPRLVAVTSLSLPEQEAFATAMLDILRVFH